MHFSIVVIGREVGAGLRLFLLALLQGMGDTGCLLHASSPISEGATHFSFGPLSVIMLTRVLNYINTGKYSEP